MIKGVATCAVAVTLIPTLSWGYGDIIGWHWYNEPIQIKKKKDKKQDQRLVQAFQSLPAEGQLKILQMATRELKAKAILTGKVSDIASYKRAQDFWVQKASDFSVGWEKMLLLNPSLDYSIKHTHENGFIDLSLKKQHAKEKQAARELSKENGLILFYRSKEKGDLRFKKTVERYATSNHFAWIPVSVDQGKETKGRLKANALGIHYFPALMLVNPITKKKQIVSYGFKAESEIEERMLKIKNNWKTDF